MEQDDPPATDQECKVPITHGTWVSIQCQNAFTFLIHIGNLIVLSKHSSLNEAGRDFVEQMNAIGRIDWSLTAPIISDG